MDINELPIEIVRQYDHLAAARHQSRDSIIERALLDWLDWYYTNEAIAQADRGELIPHSAVVEWVESLDTGHPLPKPTAG